MGRTSREECARPHRPISPSPGPAMTTVGGQSILMEGIMRVERRFPWVLLAIPFLVGCSGGGGGETELSPPEVTPTDGVGGEADVPCVPACDGTNCGLDGCGGVCSCESGDVCLGHVCVPPVPLCVLPCGGQECGVDDCGHFCGVCGPGSVCTDGKCVFRPIGFNDLEDGITVTGMVTHLAALDILARRWGSDRSAGTRGWTASLDYVKARLLDAGYAPRIMSVEYPYFKVKTPPVLEVTGPGTQIHAYTYAADDDAPVGEFQRINLSRPGEVTAEVTAVGLELGLDNRSSSGCESIDFLGFPTGNIALLQRGTCPFVDKALNAQAAGASAVILFNQGDTPERIGLFDGGLAFLAMVPTGADHGIQIPGLFATYEVGVRLATLMATGATVKMHVKVDTIFEVRQTQNVLAETAAGNPDHVILLGAHLDSAPGGPGINDNGSGVAALLEIARAAAAYAPTQKLRFAFWGAEELGWPWGSAAYVRDLSEANLGRVKAYLNIDMLGSSNDAVFVYDGDGSDFGMPGPEGSAALEKLFVDDLRTHSIPHVATYNENSDHFAFILAGIPYGGLVTGARDLKTRDEARLFGGTAGKAYDPCNHRPCDTLHNVNVGLATTLAKSYARVVQSLVTRTR